MIRLILTGLRAGYLSFMGSCSRINDGSKPIFFGDSLYNTDTMKLSIFNGVFRSTGRAIIHSNDQVAMIDHPPIALHKAVIGIPI